MPRNIKKQEEKHIFFLIICKKWNLFIIFLNSNCNGIKEFDSNLKQYMSTSIYV